jgi:hypothetical protein
VEDQVDELELLLRFAKEVRALEVREELVEPLARRLFGDGVGLVVRALVERAGAFEVAGL